ncbi:nitroreductase/quinone reductase family protein [Microbacterium amylolyticum]|uniref:nitroreductase/quinone reductase family protein n=1 Tax=Microbacterium amylolyticum TaxID=936337 RepID=UPI0013EDF2AA|nr:nitroreductase/quinone reductase family protein [Microbacterium amylolyticum]
MPGSLAPEQRRNGRNRHNQPSGREGSGTRHTLAMNGWGEGHPAWWLNLMACPEATIELADGSRHNIRARAAHGDERARMWEQWLANEDVRAVRGIGGGAHG